ncbi:MULTISPECIES: hypothetical protein [unclassified Microcoleus]
MLEAAILGSLLKVAFDGIVGTQANDALKHLCLTGIKKNHETENLSITI